MNILRPLPKEELNNFFSEHSLKVIQYFMHTSLFAQPEVYKSKESLPIQIPKEHLEQWFVQALQVEYVGAGSYPIDIMSGVLMLRCSLVRLIKMISLQMEIVERLLWLKSLKEQV